MKTNRYKGSILVKEKSGDWISPKQPFIDSEPRKDDQFHRVRQGDRLDLLAHKYLGDAKLWWVIAEYNEISWFFDLELNQELRIPSFEHTYLDLLR